MKKNNMNSNDIDEIEPSRYLKGAVLGRISREKEKVRFRRIIFFRTGIFFSVCSLAVSGFFFGHEIMTSDFWLIASLGLSDMEHVVNYWQEFCWSLMETFPSTEVAGILFPFLLAMLLIWNRGRQELRLKFKY